MSNQYPCVFYMNWKKVDELNSEYLNAGYELGWYYQLGQQDLPVGPFLTEDEAITEAEIYLQKFEL